MANTAKSGLVEYISPIIENTGSGKSFKKQTLVILCPAYVDQFGDKRGKDEYWEFAIYNTAAEGEALLNRFKQGDKVTVEFYLNSKEFRFKTTGSYQYELRIANVKAYQAKQS